MAKRTADNRVADKMVRCHSAHHEMLREMAAEYGAPQGVVLAAALHLLNDSAVTTRARFIRKATMSLQSPGAKKRRAC